MKIVSNKNVTLQLGQLVLNYTVANMADIYIITTSFRITKKTNRVASLNIIR